MFDITYFTPLHNDSRSQNYVKIFLWCLWTMRSGFRTSYKGQYGIIWSTYCYVHMI